MRTTDEKQANHGPAMTDDRQTMVAWCDVMLDAAGRPRCPVCGGTGMERKQKWYCPRCGQLLATCCD